jgi:hypothetical protein
MHRAGQGLAGIGAALRAHVAGAVIAAAAAAPLSVICYLVPARLVLPLLSISFLTAGGALALIAWWVGSDRHANQITVWDLAGACTLLGCGAGILSTPADVLAAFGLTAGG